MVGVDGDPLGVGRPVLLEQPGVVGAVADGVAAPVGVAGVGVLTLGDGGGGDDADAGRGAAGASDDLPVDLGVVLLQAAADKDQGPLPGGGGAVGGLRGWGGREEGEGEDGGGRENGAACGGAGMVPP
ncbi:hypothetical protein ACH4ZX_27270 [Streptomyces sp. NPDC020490]|uniref:hypothetical protein n=1 Tax=Streptomyces sp. NPDC020490 TaxID=3365078 RepID=UPI00379A7633